MLPESANFQRFMANLTMAFEELQDLGARCRRATNGYRKMRVQRYSALCRGLKVNRQSAIANRVASEHLDIRDSRPRIDISSIALLSVSSRLAIRNTGPLRISPILLRRRSSYGWSSCTHAMFCRDSMAIPA
jgi:hypothetical protein